MDLLRELDRAEKRPPDGFALAPYDKDGDIRAAIVAPVPSRLTVPLPLPRHGSLRVAVALAGTNPAAGVRFRIGVSDHRIYEGLDEITIAGDRRGWTDMRVDLSAYAGWKWSLFYRPERVTWRLVLATDPAGPAETRAVWGTPQIVADSASAKEYRTRRALLQR